jgi:hypothetical protein
MEIARIYGMDEVSPGRYRSPAGLIYGKGSGHAHRLPHLFAHARPDDSKPTHTMFRGDIDIVALVDEAWLRRGDPDPKDPDAYVVDMGDKVGTQGEEKVRIVVQRDGVSIRSAYPVR